MLYYLDGSVEIYNLSITRFLKEQHAIYLNQVYKQPMLLFGILFIPSSSHRSKNCIWVNMEFFKLDTMLYHSNHLNKYPGMFILEKIYLVYLKVITQMYQRDIN